MDTPATSSNTVDQSKFTRKISFEQMEEKSLKNFAAGSHEK